MFQFSPPAPGGAFAPPAPSVHGSICGAEWKLSRELQVDPAPADVSQAIGALGLERFGDEPVDLLPVLSGAAHRLPDRRRHRPPIAAPDRDMEVRELGSRGVGHRLEAHTLYYTGSRKMLRAASEVKCQYDTSNGRTAQPTLFEPVPGKPIARDPIRKAGDGPSTARPDGAQDHPRPRAGGARARRSRAPARRERRVSWVDR